MDGTRGVSESARTIGVRYPEWKRKLLESVQLKRGDEHLSGTVTYALDRVIEEHFPGAISEAA